MRREPFASLIIKVLKILAAAFPLGISVRIQLQFERVRLFVQLTFHVTSQVEVASMSDTFQFAVLAVVEKRKRVFNIRRAGRVVTQFVWIMLSQNEPFVRQPHRFVPGHTTIAPVLVPALRRVGVAEEFDFHLLELSRTEREVSRRDLVAEALTDLRDAERNLHATAVADIFEVHKNPLSRFRSQERSIFFRAKRSDDRLEHQVEFTRLGQRARLRRSQGEHRVQTFAFRSGVRADPAHVDSFDRAVLSKELLPVLLLHFVELSRSTFRVVDRLFRCRVSHNEDAIVLFRLSLVVRCPATANLVEPIPLLRLATVDHHVVKQVVVARAFPDLRVHDDRRLDADHVERTGGSFRRGVFVVRGHHVPPPGFPDIPFQLDTQRAVIPEALKSAVDF